MSSKLPGRVPLNPRALSSQDTIFRISPCARQGGAVDAWLLRQQTDLQEIARRWFNHMRRCGADVGEALHDGRPVACVADAPFGYVNVFTSHVNVGFFNGVALADPSGLLAGSGKRTRHVKLVPARAADAVALSNLIDAAYTDIKRRLGTQLYG